MRGNNIAKQTRCFERTLSLLIR